MLKIKEGSSIQPIGPTGETYTSETPLPQDILEHLQTRYPEDIEDDEPDADKAAKAAKAAEDKAAKAAKAKADAEAKAAAKQSSEQKK